MVSTFRCPLVATSGHPVGQDNAKEEFVNKISNAAKVITSLVNLVKEFISSLLGVSIELAIPNTKGRAHC
jgi:hypothetical protein